MRILGAVTIKTLTAISCEKRLPLFSYEDHVAYGKIVSDAGDIVVCSFVRR